MGPNSPASPFNRITEEIGYAKTSIYIFPWVNWLYSHISGDGVDGWVGGGILLYRHFSWRKFYYRKIIVNFQGGVEGGGGEAVTTMGESYSLTAT